MIDDIALKNRPDGTPSLMPTLEIIVFALGPRAELAAGFVAFHELFCARHGAGLRWYKTNVMKASKALDGSAPAQFRHLLAQPKALTTPLLGVEQHAGPAAQSYGLPSFDFFSEPDAGGRKKAAHRSYLRICLPIAEAQRPDELVAEAKALLGTLAFESGYGGYSYYWDVTDSATERELEKKNRGWLLRYPGLGHGEPLASIGFASEGILGVSWLTFLGAGKAEDIGGKAALAESLGTGIEVHDIAGGGLLIRAGRVPELGDSNRQDWPAKYASVGAALAELAVPDDEIENLVLAGMDSDEVVDWYRRFFDAKDGA